MTKRTKKTILEEVVEEDNNVETYNDIDEIKTVLKTVPEPTEVNSDCGDTPNNNDVMLPRSASRYVPPLR